MERLTGKVLTPENRVMYMPNTNSHLETMEKGIVFDYFKMWQSLGRFEDFMEEQGFEDLEDLRVFVTNAKQTEESYIMIDKDEAKKAFVDAMENYIPKSYKGE